MNRKILIACEYSGTVRDVLNILNDGWDMLIAFPPCTYLSFAAYSTHWFDVGRLEKRLEALAFFGKLYNAPVKHICLENPKGCASPTIAKYSQIIQPYYFGDPYIKTTCLWLKNLPPLIWHNSNNLFEVKTAVEPKYYAVDAGKNENLKYIRGVRSPHKRSRFWNGVANAMAEQWTNYLANQKAFRC